MATLNPVLNASVSIEQPVARRSALSSVFDLAGSFLDSAPRPAAPTAGDRQNAALSGLATELYQYHNSDMASADFVNLARDRMARQIVATPEYATEVKALGAQYGVGEPTQLATPQDSVNTALNDALKTPEGQAVFQQSIVLGSDGQVDNEATQESFYRNMSQVWREQATLDSLTRRTQTQRLTDESLTRAFEQEMLPAWSTTSNDAIASLISMATSVDSQFYGSPQDQISFVTERRRQLSDRFTSAAIAAGLKPEDYQPMVAAALAPFDNVLTSLDQANAAGQDYLETLKTANQLQLSDQFVKTYGAIGASPEFQRMLLETLASKTVGENYAEIMTTFETMDTSGVHDVPSIFPTLDGTVSGGVQAGLTSDPVSPDLVKTIRDELVSDPNAVTNHVTGANSLLSLANPNTSDGQNSIITSLGTITAASAASDKALGASVLSEVFSPVNVRTIATAAEKNPDVLSVTNAFAANQLQRNASFIETELRTLNSGGGNLVEDTRTGVPVLGVSTRIVVTKNASGSLVVGRQMPDGAILPLSGVTGVSDFTGAEDLITAVNNINTLNIGMARVNRDLTEFRDASTIRLGGIVTTVLPAQVSGGDGRTSVGGSSGNDTLSGPTLLSLVDRNEGGADYNTLFGHANREGRQFSNITVSTMTIGQLKEFASARGPGSYGEYVQGANPEGVLATPMGRYQFVGSTLASTARAMNLPDSTVFTPAVQDAMFVFKINERLRGETTQAGKRQALRNEWAGFKSVSDAELDAAIANFESGGAMSFADGGITVAPYSALAPSTSAVPAARPVDLPVTSANISSMHPSARPDALTPMTAEATVQATKDGALSVGASEDAVRQELARLSEESKRLTQILLASEGRGGNSNLSVTTLKDAGLGSAVLRKVRMLGGDENAAVFTDSNAALEAFYRGAIQAGDVVVIGNEAHVVEE